MKRINFNLDELQAFIAVAEKSSFKAAADDLFLSAPALSRRIEKLESTLGTRLLERTTRRVSLTHVGRQFLAHARSALDGLEDAVLRIADTAALRRGLVTVACVPSVAHQLLPQALTSFAAQFPNIRIKVIDEGANDVLESVLSGDADFGLNFMGAQEPDIDFKPIYRESYLLALRRDHALAGRTAVAWEDLADEKMISVSKSSGNRLLIDNALSRLAKRPSAFYEANHVAGVLGMVAAGLGVAAVPSLALPESARGLLTGIPLVKPAVSRILGLISRKGRPLPPAAAALYGMLKPSARPGAHAGTRP